MGGADDKLGANWIKSLQDTGVRLIVVDRASHFLDGENEFELLDEGLSLPGKIQLSRPNPK
jgi:hypothetical protein